MIYMIRMLYMLAGWLAQEEAVSRNEPERRERP
jgi:hypothetical protein